MATDPNKKTAETKKTVEDETGTRPVIDRSYMKTWGSDLATKAAYAEAHEKDEETSEEDAIKREAERPGVNPVISPAIDAEGKPL